MSILLDEKKAIAVVNFLAELSCCSRCIIRYLGVHCSVNDSAYKDPKGYLLQLVSKQESEEKEANLSEPFAKKLKPNICPVCLDCFEQDTVEKVVDSLSSLDIADYKYNNFFFNVSFPKCLAIRAHCMLLHLKEQFPDFSFGNVYEVKSDQNEVKLLEQPHKIFRALATETLSKAVGKQYHPKSNLNFLITIGYESDSSEVFNMKNIIRNKNFKKNDIEISRNNIFEFLKDVDDNLMRKNFPVPPEIPDKAVQLEKVEVTADPIYLGGRYLKFKRNVGQTPWVIDGVSVTEHNIQDIIFDAISSVLGCKKSDMTFTASGREDVDVRMLGSGRPFYIKIDNPRQRQFSSEQFLEVERKVIETELAAVIKLQSIFASEIERIKHGEEKKSKTYRALCKTTAPNIKDVISAINKQERVNLLQLTVMRVLHRRTLMSRDRIIYRMFAVEVPGHSDLFELEMVTQAGTYVKEFVHGDFERTQPNISSIVGYPTDLVALDCVDIDLVWPENELSVTENK